ncbi:hypothetical protein [Methylacidimicrobium cyclopophantes]|uniref:hypothetical protein n=1 Tax=Methylacidimicrobium cyclopophantes TaxID=1041766 RepID=UPI001159EC8D|nr:hypothetical protein [Methylacidimicrobium cyclopophantes]
MAGTVQAVFQAALFFITARVAHLHGKPEKLKGTVRIEQAESGHLMASATFTFRPPPGAAPFGPRHA